MKRLLPACLVILTILSALPVSSVAAQTPVVTPDPFRLPINQLLLRIMEGNGFEYLIDESGMLVYGNIHIIRDGVIPDDIPPSLGDIYSRLHMQDNYYMYVVMMPENRASGPSGDIGVTIESRLITLADGDSAAQLVEMYPDIIAGAMPPTGAPADISMIPNPPAHHEAIVGVAGMDPYINLASGMPSGIDVPYSRFIAQDGATVASIKVSSLDPAFNDAVARGLLASQLSCLTADQYCVPIPLPEGIPYEPGTPIASPVARSPERRMATARSRA